MPRSQVTAAQGLYGLAELLGLGIQSTRRQDVDEGKTVALCPGFFAAAEHSHEEIDSTKSTILWFKGTKIIVLGPDSDDSADDEMPSRDEAHFAINHCKKPSVRNRTPYHLH